MEDLKLKPASSADVDTVSKIASLAWNHHYPSIISQRQIDYMLSQMYSRDSLIEQMEKKNHDFFLLYSGSTAVGFISVNREQKNNWFLNKFYIDPSYASKGIGSAAFALLLNIIQPEKITLTVNRQNFKSINFYFKNGFRIERVADFDIGSGYMMNDFVMEWRAMKN